MDFVQVFTLNRDVHHGMKIPPKQGAEYHKIRVAMPNNENGAAPVIRTHLCQRRDDPSLHIEQVFTLRNPEVQFVRSPLVQEIPGSRIEMVAKLAFQDPETHLVDSR